MGNKSSNKQISEGQADKKKYGNLIENFSYDQASFKEGLSNPFADATNTSANLGNPAANQQVALQASEFQGQRQDANQANILDAIVQGGGGAASSATAIAQQAQLGNQQIAAGIETQEARIGQEAAQGEQRRQEQVASGEARRQQLVGSGEQYITGLSENRASAELAGLGNLQAGAQQTINAGYKAKSDKSTAIIGAVGQVAAAATKFIPSDHRLKENIEFQRFSDSGIPIYQFSYIDHPEHTFEGAMSAGVPEEAVIKNWEDTGFDGVDYGKIDVNFKQIK